MKEASVQKLWEQIETFAAYGFGKAHAASYGNLAYKTAYMKANYPVDYMASVLTADAGDVDKVALVVAECVRMGLKILPPSVNESRGNFTALDDTSIRFGLYSIKNFGTGVADSIMKAVDSGGPFTDVADFLSRVPDKNLNKKSLESLIKCGALDELAGSESSGTAVNPRGQLLANIDLLLGFHREHADVPANQSSLFGSAPQSKATFVLKDASPATMTERLLWEKELLGLYVSGHPLDAHKEKLAKQKMTLMEAKEKFPKGAETVIAGLLQNLQYILTKNGEKMLFARLSDYSGSVEIVVFPRTLKENEALVISGTCVLLKGKFSLRNGESSFLVEKVKAL